MSRAGLSILIFKCFIFSTIVAGAVWEIMPQYDTSYNAALHDKIDRIETIEEPKIVLIGNSNVAFGFDSEMIEEAFGMPVVNMGLHGALGNAFHEEMSKLNVREGDIYVVCHLSFSDDDELGDGTMAWTAIEKDLSAYQLIRFKDIPVLVKGYPAYLHRCINLWRNGEGNQEWDGSAYGRDAFNKYGDVAVLREECTDKSMLEQSGQELEAHSYLSINNTCVERMNELNIFMKERGAVLVAAGRPICVKEEPSPEFKEFLTDYRKQLDAELECEVISDFRDYCYDVSYFYDGMYHLNTKGARKRTSQLIMDLEQYGVKRK